MRSDVSEEFLDYKGNRIHVKRDEVSWFSVLFSFLSLVTEIYRETFMGLFVVGLNLVSLLCLFSYSYNRTAFSVLVMLSVGSLLNAYSFLFGGGRKYQLYRCRKGKDSSQWTSPRSSYSITKPFNESVNRLFFDDQMHSGTAYELDEWKYTLLQKWLFIFFSPVQLLGMTAVHFFAPPGDEIYKAIVVSLCYFTCAVVYTMSYRFEEKMWHQYLRSNEVLIEQTRSSDLIWNAAYDIISRLPTSSQSTLEKNSLMNIPTSAYVQDSYVPTAVLDDDDRKRSPEVEHEDLMAKREIQRGSNAQRQVFDQTQREIRTEIERLRRRTDL